MKQKRIKKVLMSTLFIGLALPIFSQSTQEITVRDFETWTSASLNYKINRKLKIGLGQELRLKDNSAVVDQFFTSGYGEYKIWKPISLGSELRYIRSNDDQGKVQGYENHFRYAFYTTLGHDVNRYTFKYRLQYQRKNELGLSEAEAKEPIEKLRFKISGKYNIRKWKLDPKVSVEIFRTMGSFNDFSKFRATIGTEYKTEKSGSFKFFYRFEKELNEAYPQWTNILGLKYEFNIKRKYQ